jgi:hypothetical protein
MVVRVSHDDVAAPIHCDSERKTELSKGPFSVFMTLLASARQSGHLALWRDYADTMIFRVSHNDVAALIHCNSTGPVELRNAPFSVLIALLASACQSGHKPLWCDLADAMVDCVSYDDIPAPIHRDSGWTVKLSKFPFSVFMAFLASARQGGHISLWCDSADTMVVRVSHDDISVLIHCDPRGNEELRNGPFSVLMALGASASYCGHRVAVHPAFHKTQRLDHKQSFFVYN